MSGPMSLLGGYVQGCVCEKGVGVDMSICEYSPPDIGSQGVGMSRVGTNYPLPPQRDTVATQAVRILLKCFLVFLV